METLTKLIGGKIIGFSLFDVKEAEHGDKCADSINMVLLFPEGKRIIDIHITYFDAIYITIGELEPVQPLD